MIPSTTSFKVKLDATKLKEAVKTDVTMIGPNVDQFVDEINLAPGQVEDRGIVKIVDGVRAKGNTNFGVLFDTCHAYMCAVVGANHSGEKETLKGGEIELLEKLKGKVTHVHLIDSDGSLNEHNTSTHNPFGTGRLDFDKLAPALNQCGVFSGTMMKSPFATCRDAPPSMPVPLRFSALVRVSAVSLPPVIVNSPEDVS